MKEKLTQQQGAALLRLARRTIADSLGISGGEKYGCSHPRLSGPAFHEKRGNFVTLHIDGRLRGCIGSIDPLEPLCKGIEKNALNAAFKDPRFPPLARDELAKTVIEVSILTRPEPLEYEDSEDLLSRIRPGADGLVIKKGFKSATFLPQVWKQLPEPEQFLSHLCMKAGLAAEEWRKGRIGVKTYQVQYFEEQPPGRRFTP